MLDKGHAHGNPCPCVQSFGKLNLVQHGLNRARIDRDVFIKQAVFNALNRGSQKPANTVNTRSMFELVLKDSLSLVVKTLKTCEFVA